MKGAGEKITVFSLRTDCGQIIVEEKVEVKVN